MNMNSRDYINILIISGGAGLIGSAVGRRVEDAGYSFPLSFAIAGFAAFAFVVPVLIFRVTDLGAVRNWYTSMFLGGISAIFAGMGGILFSGEEPNVRGAWTLWFFLFSLGLVGVGSIATLTAMLRSHELRKALGDRFLSKSGNE
ncbi:hypothetical protein [Ornithinimicrobium sp. INDO-MA30-4]|uniref:hypothetical protein n=1 Tax=Ornithinimicrobium sp. INDO-MA30-4 TaxID=2908651 RepID=UPI001F2A2D02|nr:hypothetical protein [Ornithinimicrobium sp. INDO-MA30-4]UJH70129.1 hypothetical protein L0A91_13145 [Ornithinimicrobium sp. INDO-MA30-4]